MNRLECTRVKSKFSNRPHLGLIIDGMPLDEVLDREHPARQLLGLIPTFLDCLTGSKDQELVWKRIRPDVGRVERAPVLMCPDECDLSCGVIVAEVESKESAICWHRLGIDHTEGHLCPEGLGTTVEWLDRIGPYTFERTEYENCLRLFRDSI